MREAATGRESAVRVKQQEQTNFGASRMEHDSSTGEGRSEFVLEAERKKAAASAARTFENAYTAVGGCCWWLLLF